MPRRKTTSKKESVTMDISEIENRDDIKICKAWIDFKQGLFGEYENADKIVVDLQFESSYDTNTHYNFAPDEVIFLTDIGVSPENDVVFMVPYSDRSKTFSHKEAECVSWYTDDESTVVRFDEVVNKHVANAFHHMGISTAQELKDRFLAKDTNLREILTAPEEYVEHVVSTTKARVKYKTLPNFGKY